MTAWVARWSSFPLVWALLAGPAPSPGRRSPGWQAETLRAKVEQLQAAEASAAVQVILADAQTQLREQVPSLFGEQPTAPEETPER